MVETRPTVGREAGDGAFHGHHPGQSPAGVVPFPLWGTPKWAAIALTAWGCRAPRAVVGGSGQPEVPCDEDHPHAEVTQTLRPFFAPSSGPASRRAVCVGPRKRGTPPAPGRGRFRAVSHVATI